MAGEGEAAAAAGLDVVAQSGKVRDGATEINKTRDMVAGVMTTRARSKVSATAPTSPQVGDLWFEPI